MDIFLTDSNYLSDLSDGNTSAAFHEKCDNKGATIVIAKITNSEQIIGGYNSFNGIQLLI